MSYNCYSSWRILIKIHSEINISWHLISLPPIVLTDLFIKSNTIRLNQFKVFWCLLNYTWMYFFHNCGFSFYCELVSLKRLLRCQQFNVHPCGDKSLSKIILTHSKCIMYNYDKEKLRNFLLRKCSSNFPQQGSHEITRRVKWHAFGFSIFAVIHVDW